MNQSHGAIWRRITILAIGVLVPGALTAPFWWSQAKQRWFSGNTSSQAIMSEPDGHNHDGHTHDDHGHDHGSAETQTTLELSETALKNLGLSETFLQPVAVSTFRRSVTIPAVIVPRPGRTQIEVSAPLTGVVTHVHAVTGEAVTPGTLLFEIRLTHEELVAAQTEFLKSLGELDVEQREIARLESAAESGAISARTLLERRYSLDRLQALLRAQREALKLHGLSDRQVEDIEREKRLLRGLQIVAPVYDRHSHEELRFLNTEDAAAAVAEPETPPEQTPLIVEHLMVRKGQSVAAGETLCTVADLSQLYIEGQAFDQDGPALSHAAEQRWPVTAVFPGAPQDESVPELSLEYISSEVDRESRALGFFVELPNRITADRKNSAGQRFVTWKYRPGQRLQLQVPVEEWSQQIVVPIDAVVQEGADWYVFRRRGSEFERVAVHLRYRDQTTAVIDRDGSVFPGEVLALRAAHQMQLAVKNKSGAGVDPHAGHTH